MKKVLLILAVFGLAAATAQALPYGLSYGDTVEVTPEWDTTGIPSAKIFINNVQVLETGLGKVVLDLQKVPGGTKFYDIQAYCVELFQDSAMSTSTVVGTADIKQPVKGSKSSFNSWTLSVMISAYAENNIILI